MNNLYASSEFEEKYSYTGTDLGASWTEKATLFRVWAPTAASVCVRLYHSGDPAVSDPIQAVDMQPDACGTWVASVPGNLSGVYYTYLVTFKDHQTEACDPYARAAGVNGKRSMVIDLQATDPTGWTQDRDPNAGSPFTDAVIYELHIRDLSIDPSSGIQNAGKYLGLAETGTVNSYGMSTGLDHIRKMGITHLHLLPFYDYGSVDEAKLNTPQFNWGYDPVNYNVPEGSYASDPCDGAVRIRELKKAIQVLHRSGISVVMDVVYNHVFHADEFCFNQIVPGYFSREKEDGTLSNGSGCGNDTASERSMVRKYIVDSVKYWADEYHIDGFRFDLAGLIDVDTVNAIVAAVHASHPNVVFYGEGWDMPTAVTKPDIRLATQKNAVFTPGFSYFSDLMRDTLRGTVFVHEATGFISGATDALKGLVSSYLGAPEWAQSPLQVINYASCHDNHTLMDRLTLSAPEATVEERVRMNLLAAAIYLTAQGVPFIHAGEEMLRSKPSADGKLIGNSYKSPDEVNSIKWDMLEAPLCQKAVSYYRGLIAFRKAHPSLRLTRSEEVARQIAYVPCGSKQAAAFHIGMDTEDELFAVFNAGKDPLRITLPDGSWNVCVNADQAGTAAIETLIGNISVPAISALILSRKD